MAFRDMARCGMAEGEGAGMASSIFATAMLCLVDKQLPRYLPASLPRAITSHSIGLDHTTISHRKEPRCGLMVTTGGPTTTSPHREALSSRPLLGALLPRRALS